MGTSPPSRPGPDFNDQTGSEPWKDPSVRNCIDEWLGLLTTRLNQVKPDAAPWWVDQYGHLRNKAVIDARAPDDWVSRWQGDRYMRIWHEYHRTYWEDPSMQGVPFLHDYCTIGGTGRQGPLPLRLDMPERVWTGAFVPLSVDLQATGADIVGLRWAMVFGRDTASQGELGEGEIRQRGLTRGGTLQFLLTVGWEPGWHTVYFTAYDADGAYNTINQSFEVVAFGFLPPGQPPWLQSLGIASVAQRGTIVPGIVHVTPGDSPVEFVFASGDFADGGELEMETYDASQIGADGWLQFSFPAPDRLGTFLFSMAAVDTDGRQSEFVSQYITVVEDLSTVGHSPVLSDLSLPAEVQAGQTVQATVDLSDADGDPAGLNVELTVDGVPERQTALSLDGACPGPACHITLSFDVLVTHASLGRLTVQAIDYAGHTSNILTQDFTILPPPVAGIYGRVTYQGAPAPNISLRLRFHDGSEWSTAANTVTDSDGNYLFQDVPGLSAGQSYYVRYGHNGDDDPYVSNWYGPTIEDYTSGASVHGGDFDIANVTLVSPAHRASVGLPATFQWNRRGIAGDTYRWRLFDPEDSLEYISSDLGDTDTYVLSSLPGGFELDHEYGWSMLVYNDGNGYGRSFYYRRVTLGSGDAPPVLEDLEFPASVEAGLRTDGSVIIRDPDADVVSIRVRIFLSGSLSADESFPIDMGGLAAVTWSFQIRMGGPGQAEVDFLATDAKGNKSNLLTHRFDVKRAPTVVTIAGLLVWNSHTQQATIQYAVALTNISREATMNLGTVTLWFTGDATGTVNLNPLVSSIGPGEEEVIVNYQGSWHASHSPGCVYIDCLIRTDIAGNIQLPRDGVGPDCP